MEKSVEFEIADYIKEVLEMKEVEPEGYSPLTLAYIGDSIYDLIIKTKVISEGNKQVKKLHQETSSMVQALSLIHIQMCIRDRIKKCNDFGAGGVSVAIGELADGLQINLDKVPKKYAGLDGTEIAISESQERMAVVVDPKDVDCLLYTSRCV